MTASRLPSDDSGQPKGGAWPYDDGFSSIDVLCEALDGQFLLVGHRAWLVRLFGVHAGHDSQWLQLQLLGDSTHDVILRMPRAALATQVLSTLEAWLQKPERDDNRVIEMMA